MVQALTWLIFTTWLQCQVADLAKVACNVHTNYWNMVQEPNQSVQNYISKKRSTHNNLHKPYSEGQCKDHIHMGLLQDMCWEFDKWAVKLDDLSMEEFVAKLVDIEDAMPKRDGKI